MVLRCPAMSRSEWHPNRVQGQRDRYHFDTWEVPDTSTSGGGLTFGVALPENALTADASEFIGYLVSVSIPDIAY